MKLRTLCKCQAVRRQSSLTAPAYWLVKPATDGTENGPGRSTVCWGGGVVVVGGGGGGGGGFVVGLNKIVFIHCNHKPNK